MKFSIKVSEIAQLLGAEIIGDGDIVVNSVARIEDALQGDITFFADEKYRKHFETSEASCIIVPEKIDNEPKENQVFLKVENPYKSFVGLLSEINNRKPRKSSFISPSSIVGESSEISKSAWIGHNVVIGNNCKIGENVIIESGCVLYDNIEIGEGTQIHANTTIYDDSVVGCRCILHSGSVIGADGFGFVENKDGSYSKIPQLGNVVIGNDVEIGANATIDRAIAGSTTLSNGVKIDNLVHIAHNCTIGENTAMAAQTGISGSTVIGKRCRLGGQVGISGHIEICDDVTIIAQSGVSKSVTKKGIYFGSPIKERLKAFKIEACIRRLPDIVAEFDDMKKKLKD